MSADFILMFWLLTTKFYSLFIHYGSICAGLDLLQFTLILGSAFPVTLLDTSGKILIVNVCLGLTYCIKLHVRVKMKPHRLLLVLHRCRCVLCRGDSRVQIRVILLLCTLMIFVLCTKLINPKSQKHMGISQTVSLVGRHGFKKLYRTWLDGKFQNDSRSQLCTMPTNSNWKAIDIYMTVRLVWFGLVWVLLHIVIQVLHYHQILEQFNLFCVYITSETKTFWTGSYSCICVNGP